MALTYRIDPEKRRVFTSGQGVVTFEEAKAYMERLRADPAFDPTSSQLLDYRKLNMSRISSAQVVELAKEPLFAKEARRAFVTSEPAAFGLARVFAAHRASRGETGIGVFDTLKEAEDWLDGRPDEEPAAPRVRKPARV